MPEWDYLARLEQSIAQTMNSLLFFRGRATSILSASQSTFYRANWCKAQTLASPAARKYHDTATMKNDYASIPTPAACYADFCLIPVGTGSVSVAAEVAAVQRVLQASGLKYTMHSAGTTVEGRWDDVMAVIGKAHAVVHQRGVVRVQSSMRVGTRTDKKQTAEDKVKRVTDLLAEDAS